MVTYHYSKKEIKVGSVIVSQCINDEYQQFYQLVWDKYKKVADELGIYFPEKFGFCYSEIKKFKPERNLYQCEVDEQFVTRGDLDFSPYLIIESSFFSHISRDFFLNPEYGGIARGIVMAYFHPTNSDKVELISDQFQVVSKVKL